MKSNYVRLFWGIVASLILLGGGSGQANAVTVGELVDSTQEYLECKDLTWFEAAICEDAAEQANEALNNYGVSFYNGDVQIYDPAIIPVMSLNTGHSCTHTAYVTGGFGKVTLRKNGTLNFGGNSISEPIVFLASLPVDVYVRANFREEWGFRTFWGSCETYNADNYWAWLDVRTTVNQSMLFSFEPKLLDERTVEGDYIIEISPIFHVTSELGDFNTDFQFEGVSPYSGVLTFMSGWSDFTVSSSLNLLTFDFEELKRNLEGFVYDLAYSLATGVESLSDLVGEKSILEREIAARVQEAAIDYGPQMQTQMSDLEVAINGRISSALQLDGDGKRRFVVKKSVVGEKIAAVMIPITMLLN